VHTVLANLRLYLGKRLGLIPEYGTRDPKQPDSWKFLWVVDPPLFEYDEEHKRWVAAHHAFTRPHDESIQYLEKDPGKVLCYRYDLVLNGFEVAGGSIRLHDPAVQERVFAAMASPPRKRSRSSGSSSRRCGSGAAARRNRAGDGPARLPAHRRGVAARRDPLPKTQKERTS